MKRRKPEPVTPVRRLIVLIAVLSFLLILLVASAPYRARLARETAALRQRRLDAVGRQAEGERQAAARQERRARLTAEVVAHPGDPDVRLRAGLELLDLGEPEKAVQVLEPAARARPRDAEMRAALGQACEASRRLDCALDEYRVARRLAPQDVAHDLRLTTLLSRLGWRREALEILQERVARSPRHAGARIALALLQFQTNDLRAAEEQLQHARLLEPDNPAVPGLLADVYGTAGRLTEARQAIAAALRLRPDDPDFLALHGQLAQAEGDNAEAERGARAALAVQPGHTRALETLARSLRARSRPEEALAALEPLLNGPATDEGTLLMAAQLARQLGQHSRAAELTRRHARRLAQRREVERLTYRASLAPADAAIRLELGRIYLAAGDAPRAVVELRRALELRPGWAAARQALHQARTANNG